MGTWQSLIIKHVTQGMCLRVKAAVSKGISITELLAKFRLRSFGILLYGPRMMMMMQA